MTKRELIELKHKIELSKELKKNRYYIYSIKKMDKISMHEITSKLDTKNTIKKIERVFEKLVRFLSENDIEYDSLIINIQIFLYIHEDYIEQRNLNIEECILKYVIVSLNQYVKYENNKQMTIIETPIEEFDDKKYIAEYDEFVEVLKAKGYKISASSSIEDLIPLALRKDDICIDIGVDFKKNNKKDFIKKLKR